LRAELEPLQRALVETELAADAQREVLDPAGVLRRVLVVRLESIGERLDRGDECPLETLVARGVGDRELRLLREAAEQPELAVPEAVPLDERDEAAGAAVDVERRDRVPAARHGRLSDQRLVVLRLRDVRVGLGLEELGRVGAAGQLRGELGAVAVLRP